MTENHKLEIGENHRRAISVTLAALDQALCKFKRWAEGYETESVLYRERNTLLSHQRQVILMLVQDIRTVIRELRDALSLQPDVLITANAIRAHCAILWEWLEELHTKRLRGYGEPPQGLAGYLNPRTEELIGLVRKLSNATLDESRNRNSDKRNGTGH
jgi:hypothetical protein